jgi:general secretion pathway protein B
MSLILEALKKSEDKRRLGAAPDLATPFSAPRRRRWVWPIAALLVVAGVIGWTLRPSPPQQQPAATAAPKPALQTERTTQVPGQKTGAPLHSVTGNNDLTQTAPPTDLPKRPPVTVGQGGKFVPGQPDPGAPAAETAAPRSGREVFEAMRKQGAERQRMAAAQATAQPPAPREKANAMGGRANAMPQDKANAAGRAVNPAPPPVTAPAPVAPPPPKVAPVAAPPQQAVQSPPKPDAAAAVTPPAPSRAAKSPDTIGLTPPPNAVPVAPQKAAPATASAQPYAELPFSVRKSLPELKLSMHVYMADPSRRFVVLNDSRLTEGEKTSDEIFVREIRPDGVVLEFQNQRFFFPRDGL